MPNYVTSRCAVHGPQDEIQRFRDTVIVTAPEEHSDSGSLMFDFNKVVPMPASVQATESSTTAEEGVALIRARGGGLRFGFDGLGLYPAQVERILKDAGLPPQAGVREVAVEYLRKRPDVEAAGNAQLAALLETGYTDWYGWARDKWGTKWGAFRYEELEDEPTFTFRYETAWSFPTPIFEKLMEMFPSLRFDCATYDEGDNFAGRGWFNPPEGEPEFATDYSFVGPEMYQLVYGRPQPVYDDEGNEID